MSSDEASLTVLLLEVKDLEVEVSGRRVLKGVNLRVGEGEVHVIMGPNAAGKSTLLASIMGLRKYHVVNGKILFMGKDITDKPSYERAKMGIALSHQIPPSVKGLRVKDIVSAMLSKYHCSDETLLAKVLSVDYLMDRYLFVGFSGGERKRLELYLTLLQKPRLAMLDEPDSGVDVDSIDKIVSAIKILSDKGASILLVTHTGHILSKLMQKHRIDVAHLMIDGKIVFSGIPDEVIAMVFKYGYRKAVEKLVGGVIQ